MEELTLDNNDSAVTEKKPKAVKSSTKTAATKRKTITSKSPRTKDTKSASIKITADQRLGRIAEIAYLKAEKRGFAGGNPLEDWLTAEAEVDASLANNPARKANA